jgi:hypothetical protein
MSFPTLSTPPVVRSFSEEAAFDPTLRSPKESGYVQTRATTTRVPPEKWHVEYSGLTAADKVLLKAHQVTVKIGAALFSWTNPLDSVTTDVRYLAPIKFATEETFDSTGAHCSSAAFDLEEAQ